MFGAFQEERFFRVIEPRWRRLADHADACVVFADFDGQRRARARPGRAAGRRAPTRSGNEWSLIVDAPGFAATLVAWEQPRDRAHARRARRRPPLRGDLDARPGDDARRGDGRRRAWPATSTRRSAPTLEARLVDRPLALEQPVPALTSLANRVVAYLEASGRAR